MRAPGIRGRDQRGFTVTELLVALTVTVIGLAGLLSLHVTTIRGNAGAGRALEANSIAVESLEILRQNPLAEIEAYYNGGPVNSTGDDWEWDEGTPVAAFGPALVIGRANQQYHRRIYIKQVNGTTAQNLVWIQVEVLWKENEPAPTLPGGVGVRALRLETVRARSEAL